MRYRWVDVYRGIAVLFMLVLHFFVNIFPTQPISFLNYSMKGVISIGDMDIALFLFISGISIYLAISGSRKKSEDDAIKSAIIRYSKIFLLGLLLDIILIATVERIWWVLEAISLSGLIALFFVCFSDRMKLLAIAITGICYSYFTSLEPIYEVISPFPNGGLLGSVSFSGIVLVGYMCGKYLMKEKRRALPFFLKIGVVLFLAGFILSKFTIYYRGIGTFPYIVLSSGFCILLMALVYWLVELKGISPALLEDFGKSALLIFVLNYPVLILALAFKLDHSFNTEQAALISLVLILLITLISKLNKKFTR